MEIKRSGSQPSSKGPAEWFTGDVVIDPLFEAPEPARVRGASVTFQPGARTAWHGECNYGGKARHGGRASFLEPCYPGLVGPKRGRACLIASLPRSSVAQLPLTTLKPGVFSRRASRLELHLHSRKVGCVFSDEAALNETEITAHRFCGLSCVSP
jgi:hypothetical protein